MDIETLKVNAVYMVHGIGLMHYQGPAVIEKYAMMYRHQQTPIPVLLTDIMYESKDSARQPKNN